MKTNTRRFSRRSVAVAAAIALLVGGTLWPTAAAAHPDPTGHHHKAQEEEQGLGLRVNSPDELASFHPGVHWSGSGPVDNQTAKLVYAGTGCTPASYASVADEIQGNIALVDDRVSATNPADRCPTYLYAQKVQSAEKMGAIGFVQIPREGDEAGGGNAITADIPAMEIERSESSLAVRDAVIQGTEVEATMTPVPSLPAMSDVPCADGMAGPFPCDGVDLLSFVPQDEFNGAGISDIWGWTDPESGDEYVIVGKTNGVAFFRVTDPLNPVYLGELDNPALLQAVWHDMKVYENHVFVVSESEPHGMQVFDLTRLRGVEEAQEWDRDGWYRLNDAAHNVAINEDTGFAYIVGGNEGIVAPDQCLSGLHMVDIRNPKNPTFAGCYARDGGPGTAGRSVGGPVEDLSPAAYVHDTQCVIYSGPDTDYTGQEICFNASEDQITIVDVTNKLLPTTLGTFVYPNVAYAHQGWLTEDHAYLIANDELDEVTYEEIEKTRTVALDVTDLENPKLHFAHFHETTSIDHNNYVNGRFVYQSNYTSGLRVLDTSQLDDPGNPRLKQVSFFDTYPWSEDPTLDGTWSNYPFFESGTIAVSGIDEGLFLLRLVEDVPKGGAS